jgi:predicted O-linked N-acetylglucosamine transferase (SPINDLY family)
LALLRQGQFLSAERLFRQVLAVRPNAQTWFHLGVAQHAMRRLADAERSFNQAIALARDAAEARNARASVLTELGRLDDAEAELRKAIQESPGNAQAHHNLAVLLARDADRRPALAHYDQALALDPGHLGARRNRAVLRLALRDAEGALRDFEALTDDPEADAGRLKALLLLRRDDEALKEAERLTERRPGDRLAWRLKAIALGSLGRLPDADAALARSGEPGSARALYIDRALDRQKVCDWRDRDRLLEAIRAALRENVPEELSDPGGFYYAHSLPLQGSELKLIGGRVAAGIRHRAAGMRRDAPMDMPSGERLRIGFISSGMRDHPEARLLRRVLQDRSPARFEHFVYALNADDGSSCRKAIVASADLFVDCSAWSPSQIVERIRADRLHLAVDLSGNLEGCRPEVLAARVAPVQANFIGPPCTLGPGIYDYRVSDVVATPPETHADWHEHLVLIPSPHWTYDAGQSIADEGTRQSHGLPDSGLVFCAFHQPFKICPDIFALWMRLLKRTPGSVLWLLEGDAPARNNLRREAQNAGVDPRRLVFAGYMAQLEAHIGRHRHADLFLDTLHYCAQTTAADALHAGVPVVTCPGTTMAARLCAMFVHAAGMAELAVDTLERYEAAALELALNPVMLAELKKRLHAVRATSPMFDTQSRVRALERAFVAMIERQRAGLAPAMLHVD